MLHKSFGIPHVLGEEDLMYSRSIMYPVKCCAGSKTAPAPAACDLLMKTIQDVDAAGDALYQLEGLIGVMKDELLEQQQSGSVLDLR